MGEKGHSSGERDADFDELVVPVRKEELHVDKRRVVTGQGVRVQKSVAEHACRVEEALLREEVTVTRVSIGKLVPPSAIPESRYEGDTLIVPVLEEVLVVEKRLRLKEEIRIVRKQRTEQYAETVPLKSEEISIERFDEQREGPKA